MANWLTPITTLFTKAIPDRKPSDQPGNPLVAWSTVKKPTVTYEEVVTAELALRHPIVYRCLVKIAESVSMLDFYAEADERVPLAERAGARVIKGLNELLLSPNDVWSKSQLLYWMALNYAGMGRVPLKVSRNPVAPYLPVGLYPLTARFFKSETDTRGLVTFYTYGESSEVGERLPTRKKAGESDSFAFEIIRPGFDGTLDNRNNIHPLGATGLPAAIIKLLLQRAIDTASGHPNTKYIIVAEKTLTQKQKDAAIEQIENSSPQGEQSGQVLFLYNTDVKVHKLDNELNDIHSKMPMDDMARMIAGAFGIPIALIGLSAADGAKFAGNYEESRLSFWEDTIAPVYLEPFATGLTAALCPYGARIRYDLDRIPTIQTKRIKAAVELSKVTFLTRREKRVTTGWPEAPDPGDTSGYDFMPSTAKPDNDDTTKSNSGETRDSLQ